MIETYSFKLIPSWEKYEIWLDQVHRIYIFINLFILDNREWVMNIDFNKSFLLIFQDTGFISKGLLNRYIKKKICVKILHLYPLIIYYIILLSPRKCTIKKKNPMLTTWHVSKKRIMALWWNCSLCVQYLYTGYDLLTLTNNLLISTFRKWDCIPSWRVKSNSKSKYLFLRKKSRKVSKGT